MKTIFTFSKKMKTVNLFLLSFLFFASSYISNAQVTATEDFENETAANTMAVFSEGGINFNTTFRLVTYPGNFGYNNSPKFLEISNPSMTNTSSATISINTATNPGVGFRINSFAGYTSSSTGGTSPYAGIVTIKGTPVGGGALLTANINVASAGAVPGGQTREANGMVNGLSLAGTPLAGLYFTTLTFTILDTDLGNGTIGTGYLGIDHINFTTEAPIVNNYAIGNSSIVEGNAGTSVLTYNVTRSINTLAGSVQIQSGGGTATAGNDYVALPLTTVSFTAGGSLTQTVNVTINGDATIEPNETFNMTLSNPVGGSITSGTGVVTITDDDQFAEIFDDEVHNATTFSQNGVNFQATGNLDVNVGGNFGAGGSSGYAGSKEPYATGNQGAFVITSPGKSFYITSVDLWSAVVSGVGPNWVYTATNCTVTFTGVKFDGTGSVTHSAAITPTGTNGHFTVNFAGTPFANVNLSSISFSVPSPITYLQIDNFKYGVTGSNAVQVSINDVSVQEGTGGGASNLATFTVTRTANNTAFTVDLTSSNGTATSGVDYTAYPTTSLSFTNGGGLSQTVTVPILKDASIESNETFNMSLSNATNGTLFLKQVGIGTILDDDKVCETFDTEINLATTFSENSFPFSSTNRFRVANSGNINGFGSGNTPGFLIATNGAVGSMGKIMLSSVNKAFKISSIDAWVSTDGANPSSGNVTFTATLFGGGGTVSTTKAVASNSVGGWMQNITFTGTPLDNVLLTEIEVITTGSLTECDIDNFCFAMFNTVPIIELADAGNVAITNGGAASLSNNTDFGSVCVTGGTVSKTFTIKNTGAVNLTLPSLPLTIGGADAAHFSVSAQPTTPIIPGGSSTFTVVFDPSSAGLKNATITLTNNDATNTAFVVNIKGTGNANPNATITADAAVCQEGQANFSVPSAGLASLVWTGPNLASSTTNPTSANPIFVGNITYGVTVTDVNGCTASSTHSLLVNPKPIINAGANQTICAGQTVTLSANCIYNVYGTLSGGAEVPANASAGTGYVVGTFDPISNLLSLNIIYSGLGSNATAAHLHGPAGVGGTASPIQNLDGFVFGANSGSYSNSFTLTATNAQRLKDGLTYINIHSVNIGGGEIRAQLTASCSADAFVWNPGGLAGQTVITPILTTTTPYTLQATNTITGCTTLANTTVNVTPVTVPAVYGPTVITQNVSTNLFANSCEYLATIVPGAGGVSGNVTVKEWLETIPPFKFVPRHYEIVPATQGTASVTLYFTQADFNAYNSVMTNTVKLPTGPADNAGIANIQLMKYDGVSSPNNGLPESYTGSPTPVTPSSVVFDTNIGLWKITFDVSSFSGFVVTTASNPLPVTLISFTGKATEKGNELSWKTSNEKNFSHFEIQRSENTKKFDSIGEVKGVNYESYQYVDNQAIGINFYRLKMIDLDGKYSFSKIISIENNSEKAVVGQFFPNPGSGKVFIEITSIEKGNWEITTFDITGKIINSNSKVLQKGLNKIEMDKLNQGVNFVRFDNGNISEIRKVIKE